MKQELEKALAEKYPFMRREKTIEEQREETGYVYNTFWAYGYEHGSGWYNLLCEMCDEIIAAYTNANEPLDITVQQVKEKFGSLRFYYSVGGVNRHFHAIDCLGHGTFRISPVQKPVHREIAHIVQRYEQKSKTVCEKCGKHGVLRSDLRWVLTLCDDCYAQSNATKKG